jgi:ABC-2 type transport system permease protein
LREISEIGAIAYRELKKWYRSPILIFMTPIQPLLWMGLYGKALNLTGLLRIPEDLLSQLPPEATQRLALIINEVLSRYFGSSDIDFFSYIAVGMMGVILLFTAMSSGMSVAWDRRLGFLNKLLCAPINRSSILFGKVASLVVRGVAQALLVMLIGLALGLHIHVAGPAEFLAALLVLALLCGSFSTIITALTLKIKTWEYHIAINNLITLPLMFTSSALYPISLMPDWLRALATVNPLTHGIEALRHLLLLGERVVNPVVIPHIGFLVVFAAGSFVLGYFLSGLALRSI